MNEGLETSPLMRQIRRAAFFVLAAHILISPAWYQLFKQDYFFTRPWVMYSQTATGYLKGDFKLERSDGSVQMLTPTEALGLTRYPLSMSRNQAHLVVKPEDLKQVVAEICAELGAGDKLSFAGRVSTVDGWQPLDVSDICEGT